MKRRILSILISAVLIVGIMTPCAYSADVQELQFNENGKFTVLQFTDTHTTDQPYDEMIKLIEAALDTYKPDLAVFTGDNVTGGWYMSTPLSVKKAIDSFISPCEKRNIPFAVVFGNHDWQTICPKAWQLRFYNDYSMNLSKPGFRYLHRIGNYNLTVKSSDGARDAFNFWMIDSGCKNLNNDDSPVYKSQIKWYEKQSASLRDANGGEIVPSILFQHIPVNEVRKLYLEVPEGTNGAIASDGKYYILDPDKAYENSGKLNAKPGTSPENQGEYDSWVKTGDIVAAFFGHDHTNDYVGKTDDGIILGGTKTSGFQSRGDGLQGCRVIIIDENDPWNIETFSAYYKDLVGGEIPEPKKSYDKDSRWNSILCMLGLDFISSLIN